MSAQCAQKTSAVENRLMGMYKMIGRCEVLCPVTAGVLLDGRFIVSWNGYVHSCWRSSGLCLDSRANLLCFGSFKWCSTSFMVVVYPLVGCSNLAGRKRSLWTRFSPHLSSGQFGFVTCIVSFIIIVSFTGLRFSCDGDDCCCCCCWELWLLLL